MTETTMLTVAYVTGAVRKVYDLRGDPEAAHAAEDDLYAEVLQAIVDGRCDDPVLCAKQALLTRKIEFQRWCG